MGDEEEGEMEQALASEAEEQAAEGDEEADAEADDVVEDDDDDVEGVAMDDDEEEQEAENEGDVDEDEQEEAGEEGAEEQDEEDEEEGERAVSKQESSGRVISTFIPTATTVRPNDDGSYTLSLVTDATLCFVGHVRLRVEEGVVVVGGHHCTASSGVLPLFSCAFDPGSLLVIKAQTDSSSLTPVRVTLLPATSPLAKEVASGISDGGIGAPTNPVDGDEMVAISIPGFTPVWRSEQYAVLYCNSCNTILTS
jgi:hypothetical protein